MRTFGAGPLARVTSAIYCLLAVESQLLLAVAPGLVVLVVLDRDASNVPLELACLLPVGPALSAALFALRRHTGDLADLRPVAEFWRGYRLNAGGVLRLWVPWLAGLAVITEIITHRAAAGVPGWWVAVLVVIAVVALLWMADVLVITSLFTFRTVDVARLSVYFLGRTKGVTLGSLSLLVIALGVVDIASEAALAMLAVVFAGALLRVAGPLIRQVTDDFTA
ncbi:MAG TPA: glycosyl transferase [Pseudonocardiaceae bacterium]|nr:glycosyl transferase [Pseudonocardiaceae bacterium]